MKIVLVNVWKRCVRYMMELFRNRPFVNMHHMNMIYRFGFSKQLFTSVLLPVSMIFHMISVSRFLEFSNHTTNINSPFLKLFPFQKLKNICSLLNFKDYYNFSSILDKLFQTVFYLCHLYSYGLTSGVDISLAAGKCINA